MFKEFKYIPDFQYTTGWDKYALDYQNLLVKDTIYYLTKEIIHRMVDNAVGVEEKNNFKVLDVNCGTGNDFPFFFERGWKVVGCDGSAGMLNKAYEKYESYTKKGQMKLYQGMIESLEENDFNLGQFDLIFSVTGGFAYVNDEQLEKINRELINFLKPGGKMVIAHLNRFCLPEFLHRIYRLKNPFLRSGKIIKVKIKNEEHKMHLRSAGQLRKLYSPVLKEIKVLPLLAVTPPYQTGYRPGKHMLNRLKKCDLKFRNFPIFNSIADQVVVVGEKS